MRAKHFLCFNNNRTHGTNILHLDYYPFLGGGSVDVGCFYLMLLPLFVLTLCLVGVLFFKNSK